MNHAADDQLTQPNQETHNGGAVVFVWMCPPDNGSLVSSAASMRALCCPCIGGIQQARGGLYYPDPTDVSVTTCRRDAFREGRQVPEQLPEKRDEGPCEIGTSSQCIHLEPRTQVKGGIYFCFTSAVWGLSTHSPRLTHFPCVISCSSFFSTTQHFAPPRYTALVWKR